MIRIPIGQGARPAYIAGQFANRHGLIAGATGSGKSVTLMTLAEGFSRAGVPAFLADVKGDLIALKLGNPVRSLDVHGQAGERLRLRVDSLEPDMFAKLLALTDAQRGVIEVAFAHATAARRQLATLADLKRLLHAMAADYRRISATVGLVTPASLAAVQRALLGLERGGGATLFGPVTYDVADLLEQAPDGRGVITRLDATRLMSSPAVYSTVLVFILADLYERLPEVGDLEAPRLALFLDEAHLLFADAPAGLLQLLERIVRLIRSKGVGVYFASQSPADIPPVILGQLGNRIQHALRGATLADQRAIRATAETLPINPKVDAFAALASMGVGQALVSTIDDNGVPRPVDLVKVAAPLCIRAPGAPVSLPPRVRSAVSSAMAGARANVVQGYALTLATMAAGVALFVWAVRVFLGL